MVYPRAPLPIDDQIAVMRRYVGQLKAALTREYNGLFKRTGKRKDCPFEVKLRGQRIDEARHAVALAGACLQELRRQKALTLATFRPGDQVIVRFDIDGYRADPKRYLIIDVKPAERGDRFHYEVREVTTRGKIHGGRYPQPLCPRPEVIIRRSDLPLQEEAQREAEYWADSATRSTERAIRNGDLDIFKAVLGWTGSVAYHRPEY